MVPLIHPLLVTCAITATLPAAPAALPSSAATAFSAPGEHGLSAGLVDVQTLERDLLVDLGYARIDNLLGARVYGSMRTCYLQRAAAEQLARAARELRRRRPDLRLLLVDCLRPRDVQRRMWSVVAGTPQQGYVADPTFGSMHNYGIAVDLTLATAAGEQLDMGSEVHHFGDLSQPRYEESLLAAGRLAPEHIARRTLLRAVMGAAGFRGLPHEWWHFEAMDKRLARRRYAIVETLPAVMAATADAD